MWFLIIVVVVVGICVVANFVSNTTTGENYKNNSYMSQERYEVITEYEKQQLLHKGGNNLLTFTLNQYQQARNGDTGAMVALGTVYQSKLDIAYKSVFWYEKAMKAGDLEGTYWYGECCIKGYGVEKNGTLGYSFILSAARDGNQSAINAFKDRGMSIAEMRSYGIPV